MRLDDHETSGMWANLRWIAPPAADGSGTDRVEFRHRFELAVDPKCGWVQVWSGMGYALSVNGTLVSSSPRAHLWIQRDEIAHLLHSGTNEVAIKCDRSQRYAPGILVVAEIEPADGERTTLWSGPEWQCRPVVEDLEEGEPEWSPVSCPTGDEPSYNESFNPYGLASAVATRYDVPDAAALRIEAERSIAVLNGGLWPSLQRLGDHGLAVVMRLGAGHSGRAGRLAMVRSEDDGESWSSPIQIVDSPWDDQCGVLGAADGGTLLVVAYRKMRSYDGHGNVIMPPVETGPDAETMVVRSVDGGRTWECPFSLTVRGEPARAPSGKIIELPDGGLLMTQYRRDAALPASIRVSRDRGRSWGPEQHIGEHAAGPTCVARTANGRLVAAQRILDAGTRIVATTCSDDEGRTWTPPQAVSVEAEQADVIQLEDGRLLLTVGHRAFPRGVQIHVSEDVGSTWLRPQRHILSYDAFHDNGWPSSVQTHDGAIVTVSYATGNRIHPDVGMHLEVFRWRLD